ncbi:hypothetical protein DFH27DRAFT_604252 [Peziza echinospora]|nr:hypothetical protein DFH27DRAFT_604252 [Peziza echinospora]
MYICSLVCIYMYFQSLHIALAYNGQVTDAYAQLNRRTPPSVKKNFLTPVLKLPVLQLHTSVRRQDKVAESGQGFPSHYSLNDETTLPKRTEDLKTGIFTRLGIFLGQS